jgi:hypothetical protein
MITLHKHKIIINFRQGSGFAPNGISSPFRKIMLFTESFFIETVVRFRERMDVRTSGEDNGLSSLSTVL